VLRVFEWAQVQALHDASERNAMKRARSLSTRAEAMDVFGKTRGDIVTDASITAL
jgi:1,2-phenylacetyl-CoA epoxidase PaaB subunit